MTPFELPLLVLLVMSMGFRDWRCSLALLVLLLIRSRRDPLRSDRRSAAVSSASGKAPLTRRGRAEAECITSV